MRADGRVLVSLGLAMVLSACSAGGSGQSPPHAVALTSPSPARPTSTAHARSTARAKSTAHAVPAPAAPGSAAPALNTRRFVSKRWGFRIDYPERWTLRRDFRGSYLANGAWKTYAAPGSAGTPVVALTLPNSDEVTSAELRIGVSQVPAEVKTCLAASAAVRPGSKRSVRVGGADFRYFEAADAAMSHYLSVHSYRAVHDDTCYAIDLLVFGTNPQVYDPPRTPPFSQAQAFAQLRAVLQGFRFVQR